MNIAKRGPGVRKANLPPATEGDILGLFEQWLTIPEGKTIEEIRILPQYEHLKRAAFHFYRAGERNDRPSKLTIT